VYYYLTMTTGGRKGAHFLLESGAETRIGRGLECDIVLTDPLSSRIHAVIFEQGKHWRVRDAGSRNGTYVNEQKIDEATLTEDARIRIGGIELTFHASNSKPTDVPRGDGTHTQTLLRDEPIQPGDTGNLALAAIRDPARVSDLATVFQLSVKLIKSADPDEVVRLALDELQRRTRASAVGFLWLADDGQLKPQMVIPQEQAANIEISASLTELVTRRGRAVWVYNQFGGNAKDNLGDYADALCTPLIYEQQTLGAIHVYLERGRFNQADFDVAVAIGNVLVIALSRARHDVSLQTEHKRLLDKTGIYDELIGESKPMLELKSRIGRIARATGCVLIRGESGAGKELVAKAVHKASPRADRPMLAVNCAAIPRDLMESQLFGHRKGAFTGADSDHVGWFQQANTGTLFLDEVGEMTLEGQAKLLRILEGHPFLPVGSTKEITVDVRVIAATNRDLRDFVRENRFREDLYYRLSVFELHIAPLRDRGEDIERLVNFFLEHFKRQHGRTSLVLSPDAREKLLSYQWPGNVRQLRNVIDSAVVMAEGNVILPDDLGLRDVGQGKELESLRIDYWERKLIQQALERTGGNVPEAAKLLGLGRATLYRKIEEFGIDR
jgi:Nif-specific regulatory protein